MPSRLRLGIIGLGRRWRRWRPALCPLAGEAVVRAVCDPSAARAARAARVLGCAAAAGPVELIDRDDVDAVLLLDRRWFGLWPLGHACGAGKPVCCAPSLVADDAHAEELLGRVEAARLPVLMALTPALAPASDRLGELLCGRLGAARVLRGQGTLAGERARPLWSGTALGLLHGAAALFGGPPRRVAAQAVEGAGFVSLLLEFAEGRVAQVSLWRGARAGWRFEVIAAHGSARVEAPHRLRWRDADGVHLQRLPRRPPARLLLRRFVTGLRQGQPLEPNFVRAFQTLTWLRAARRSLKEGRPVALGGEVVRW
jgi:predicted dehydrogenase